jgi:hypothetical protein
MDFASLSHRELRQECQKAKLSASGSSAILRKRLHCKARNSAEIEPPAKRVKSVTDDLTCAISLELLFDPVTAEDGRLYERSAIEEHIRTSRQQGVRQFKSPLTNEFMGPRLLPAIQTKNLIETLVETGVISGELVDAWNIKNDEKKKMDKLLAKAQAGDAYLMYFLGVNYECGRKGFKQDFQLAFHWYKKGHEAGNVNATAVVGCWLAGGRHGVARNQSEGLLLTALAAERGSDFAAYHLGLYYSQGLQGVSVNTTQAIWWFQKCLSAPHKHLGAI